MKNLLNWTILSAFILISISAISQTTLLSDDFEDGDLVGWTEGATGHWTGAGTPALNGSFSMKHALSSGVDTSYIVSQVLTDPSSGEMTWRWQWKNGSWDPSGNNRFWFQLLSDQANIKDTGANGYALGIQITPTGAADPIELHRITGGVSSANLLSFPAFDVGTDSWYGFEVTRSVAGDWEVFIDNDGGFDALVSAGTITDATHAPVNPWVGALFRFTTSRAGDFWMDDVLVQSTAGGVPEVSLSIEKDTINEGQSLMITASTTLPVDADKIFSLSTAGVAISNSDYAALPATITILNGQSSASISLSSMSDANFEDPEDVQITLGLNAQTNVTMGVDNQNLIITDYVTIMTHNLLYYGGAAPGSAPTPLSVDEKNIRLAEIYNHTKPDILALNEIVTTLTTYGDSLLIGAVNVGGVNWYAKAAYDVPTGSSLSNMLIYNTRKFVLESQSTISVPGQRDPNVYNLYYNYPDLVTLNDTIRLHVIVTHLKAGTGASDINDRGVKTDSIMSYIDKNNLVNTVLMGDFNVYDDTEVGVQNLINYPANPSISLNDPINTFGAWNNNATFANVHTQSTRSSDLGDGGAFGGMDDRFDWIMTSSAMVNGTDSITNLPNSYWAVGQDGLRFNGNIISPANTSVPATVATALHESSDHLPVLMRLKFSHPVATGGAPIVTTDPNDVSICESQNTSFSISASGATGYQWQIDTTGTWVNLIDNGTFSGSMTNSVSITNAALSLNGAQLKCIITGALPPSDTSLVGTLTVNSGVTVNQSPVTACDSALVSGSWYFSTQIVSDVSIGANGCDSTSVTDLTINSSSANSIVDSAVTVYSAPSGATFTSTGIYTDTILNSSGCDSVITIDLTITGVGLNEMAIEQIILYPNPAKNVIQLSGTEELSEEAGYKVTTVTGQVVLYGEVLKSSIDISELDPGVYLLQIEKGELSKSIRFVKE